MSRIVNSKNMIEDRITKAIRAKMESTGQGVKKYLKSVYEILEEIKLEINDVIFTSKTFHSLINGKLKLDFGLDERATSAIPLILTDLYEVTYDIDYSNKNVVATIKIEIAARDENDPYVQSAINKMAYASPRSGEIINWLQWLLFAGTDQINSTWKVVSRPGKGRSYLGIMITGKDTFSFSVDPEFAGTATDNFITRSIAAAMPNIQNVLKRYVK